MYRHPVEPKASSLCPHALFWHLFLSLKTVHALRLKSVPIHVAEQVQQEEVLNCDLKLLSVAYVSGFIARRVLCGINCYECRTCLTSPMLLATNAFIYFKEYDEDKQFLTYP